MSLHSALASGLKKASATGVALQWATVSAVHTAPNSVDIYLQGSSTLTSSVSYLASYTPAVNDVVVVLVQSSIHGPDYLVVGKQA